MTAPGARRDASLPGGGAGGALLTTPFHIAVVAFLRAKQLQAGARTRVDGAGRKLPRVAVLEVMAQQVGWHIE